jgi:hypothetical protein
VLKSRKKAGAKIKILAPKNDTKAAKALSAIAEIRTLDAPMGRIFNVDSENFMIALTDSREVHHTQDVAFWAGSRHVSKDILEPLFDGIWNSKK